MFQQFFQQLTQPNQANQTSSSFNEETDSILHKQSVNNNGQSAFDQLFGSQNLGGSKASRQSEKEGVVSSDDNDDDFFASLTSGVAPQTPNTQSMLFQAPQKPTPNQVKSSPAQQQSQHQMQPEVSLSSIGGLGSARKDSKNKQDLDFLTGAGDWNNNDSDSNNSNTNSARFVSSVQQKPQEEEQSQPVSIKNKLFNMISQTVMPASTSSISPVRQSELRSDQNQPNLSNQNQRRSNLHQARPKMSNITDQQVLEELDRENQQLKALLNQNQQNTSELLNRTESLQILESEAQEENEMLKYKVASLEAQISMQGEVNHMQAIDALKNQTLQKEAQIKELKEQLKLAQNIMVEDKKEDKEAQTEQFNAVEESVSALKLLYESYKIQFSEQDELRVVKAIYTGDKPVIRLYRELLFQKVAARAIQQSEFLLKASSTKGGVGTEARVFVENKRLLNENARLKKELKETSDELTSERENHQFESARYQQQLTRVTSNGNSLKQNVDEMRRNMSFLKQEYQFAMQSMQIKTRAELESLNTKLQSFVSLQTDQQASLQNAHNDLYQENRELDKKHKQALTDFEQLNQTSNSRQERLFQQEQEIQRLNRDLTETAVKHIKLKKQAEQAQQTAEQTELQLHQLKEQYRELRGSERTPIPSEMQGTSLAELIVLYNLKEREVKDMHSKVKELKNEVSETQKQLDDKNEEVEELQKDLMRSQQRQSSSSPGERPVITIPENNYIGIYAKEESSATSSNLSQHERNNPMPFAQVNDGLTDIPEESSDITQTTGGNNLLSVNQKKTESGASGNRASDVQSRPPYIGPTDQIEPPLTGGRRSKDKEFTFPHDNDEIDLRQTSNFNDPKRYSDLDPRRTHTQPNYDELFKKNGQGLDNYYHVANSSGSGKRDDRAVDISPTDPRNFEELNQPNLKISQPVANPKSQPQGDFFSQFIQSSAPNPQPSQDPMSFLQPQKPKAQNLLDSIFTKVNNPAPANPGVNTLPLPLSSDSKNQESDHLRKSLDQLRASLEGPSVLKDMPADFARFPQDDQGGKWGPPLEDNDDVSDPWCNDEPLLTPDSQQKIDINAGLETNSANGAETPTILKEGDSIDELPEANPVDQHRREASGFHDRKESVKLVSDSGMEEEDQDQVRVEEDESLGFDNPDSSNRDLMGEHSEYSSIIDNPNTFNNNNNSQFYGSFVKREAEQVEQLLLNQAGEPHNLADSVQFTSILEKSSSSFDDQTNRGSSVILNNTSLVLPQIHEENSKPIDRSNEDSYGEEHNESSHSNNSKGSAQFGKNIKAKPLIDTPRPIAGEPGLLEGQDIYAQEEFDQDFSANQQHQGQDGNLIQYEESKTATLSNQSENDDQDQNEGKKIQEEVMDDVLARSKSGFNKECSPEIDEITLTEKGHKHSQSVSQQPSLASPRLQNALGGPLISDPFNQLATDQSKAVPVPKSPKTTTKLTHQQNKDDNSLTNQQDSDSKSPKQIQTLKDFTETRNPQTVNDTGFFSNGDDDDEQSQNSQIDKSHDSAKFNQDPLILKQATYGQIIDPSKALEQQLKARYGTQFIDDEDEDNVDQTFAADSNDENKGLRETQKGSPQKQVLLNDESGAEFDLDKVQDRGESIVEEQQSVNNTLQQLEMEQQDEDNFDHLRDSKHDLMDDRQDDNNGLRRQITGAEQDSRILQGIDDSRMVLEGNEDSRLAPAQDSRLLDDSEMMFEENNVDDSRTLRQQIISEPLNQNQDSKLMIEDADDSTTMQNDNANQFDQSLRIGNISGLEDQSFQVESEGPDLQKKDTRTAFAMQTDNSNQFDQSLRVGNISGLEDQSFQVESEGPDLQKKNTRTAFVQMEENDQGNGKDWQADSLIEPYNQLQSQTDRLKDQNLTMSLVESELDDSSVQPPTEGEDVNKDSVLSQNPNPLSKKQTKMRFPTEYRPTELDKNHHPDWKMSEINNVINNVHQPARPGTEPEVGEAVVYPEVQTVDLLVVQEESKSSPYVKDDTTQQTKSSFVQKVEGYSPSSSSSVQLDSDPDEMVFEQTNNDDAVGGEAADPESFTVGQMPPNQNDQFEQLLGLGTGNESTDNARYTNVLSSEKSGNDQSASVVDDIFNFIGQAAVNKNQNNSGGNGSVQSDPMSQLFEGNQSMDRNAFVLGDITGKSKDAKDDDELSVELDENSGWD